MKNWIPMGYDGRNSSDVKKEAEFLVRSGLAAKGFDTIILSAEEIDSDRELPIRLKKEGLKAGLAASADYALAHPETAGIVSYLELTAYDRQQIGQIRALYPEVFLTADYEEDTKDPAPGIDCMRILQSEAEDFFDLTRNKLDSCLGNGKEDCNDYPSASSERAKISAAAGILCIPTELNCLDSYDPERMRAILCEMAMIKSPVFLSSEPSALTDGQLEMLKDDIWKKVCEDSSVPGGIERYYDPWHCLFSRKLADGSRALLILNRCHGNTQTDIRDKDLGLPEGTEFVLHDLYDQKEVSSVNGIFDILVETSDKPDTPCCRLYLFRS